jgi:hypothetical protein
MTFFFFSSHPKFGEKYSQEKNFGLKIKVKLGVICEGTNVHQTSGKASGARKEK